MIGRSNHLDLAFAVARQNGNEKGEKKKASYGFQPVEFRVSSFWKFDVTVVDVMYTHHARIRYVCPGQDWNEAGKGVHSVVPGLRIEKGYQICTLYNTRSSNCKKSKKNT